ncbi:MAG: ASCH domain-containing protein [Jiangellaceae bacterium]
MPWPRVDGLRTLELGSAGPLRRRLTELVLRGSKHATAGLLAECALDGEEVERVGERLVLIDDAEQLVGLIEVVRVDVVPFGQVSWEFAEAEGEGYVDVGDCGRRTDRSGGGTPSTPSAPISASPAGP